MEVAVQAGRRKVQANPGLLDAERLRGFAFGEANWPIPCCREKPLARRQVIVPQTDTGRWGENPKALERTLVKELGKMAP